MTASDLQAAPLHELREFDFRALDRDRWADARTVQARVDAFLAALPDAAWEVPVSASDVPGAPPWTLLDHVGHVADWLDEAIRYLQPVVDGSGGWPHDEDYAGGDGFDAWNEGRRATWSGRTPAEVRAWHRASADRLLDLARQLPPGVADSDHAWEWVWPLVNAHPIDHAALAAASDLPAEPA
jgi:hypothetical protein